MIYISLMIFSPRIIADFLQFLLTHMYMRKYSVPGDTNTLFQQAPVRFFPWGCPQFYQILQLLHIFSCFSLKRITLLIGKAVHELSSAQEIWLSLVLTWIVLMDKKAEACNRWCTAILAIQPITVSYVAGPLEEPLHPCNLS